MVKTDSCNIINDMTLKYKVGSFNINSCKYGIHGIEMVESHENSGDQTFIQDDGFGVSKWFQDYCNGKFVTEMPRLCFNRTSEFDRIVYLELMKVPAGKVVSYSELSLKVFGVSIKARAIGSSMARNPFMVVVPCHRVVKSSGDLGAYSGHGGPRTKKRLLDFEKSFN